MKRLNNKEPPQSFIGTVIFFLSQPNKRLFSVATFEASSPELMANKENIKPFVTSDYHDEHEYLNLVRKIITSGKTKQDRTGRIFLKKTWVKCCFHKRAVASRL